MLDNDGKNVTVRGFYLNWANSLGAEIKDFLVLSFQFDLHVSTVAL